MEICESEKAKLLVITTKAQILDAVYIFGREWTYIGLLDETSDGHWVNWKGEALDLFWEPGQPYDEVNGDCVII
ncbi:hypothetical protein CHS0354_014012 [Potamilus streckersoni]|uniref:C-type lectin domain-containing protein n=1 Tax=Potamilus streckersoni TaxID=2493646 RepID=A0AAE0TKC7_9BIVA|nr:hypothetical protein CHS0354_014012 [Potamilus streckersoni]